MRQGYEMAGGKHRTWGEQASSTGKASEAKRPGEQSIFE